MTPDKLAEMLDELKRLEIKAAHTGKYIHRRDLVMAYYDAAPTLIAAVRELAAIAAHAETDGYRHAAYAKLAGGSHD